jgi:PAS domain S-box-containing protein
MNDRHSDLRHEAVADQAVVGLLPDRARMSNEHNHRGRILVVEDQGIVATDIGRCLEDAGFGIAAIATSMEEAIGEASRSRPDLVLMDIRIQGEADGIAAADHLHRHFSLPIVYLTAHDDSDTMERAKRTEPMAFLVKPFKPADLIRTVEFALNRSRADREVRERERSFLSAMDAIGDAVLTVDSEGSVRFMNRAAEELTGWRQEQALECPVTDVMHVVEESSAERFCVLFNFSGVPESDGNNEYRVRARGGAYHWLTIKVSSIAAAGDSSIRVVVMRDVTKRKDAELEIQQLNQELQARVRELSAVNQELESFNYSIAHDLRAPLRHIDAYTKMLLEQAGLGLPGEARTDLERVRRGARRMGLMVDGLLELSHTSRKELARRVTELKLLVKDVLLELKAEAQDREIEWRMGELPAIDCDPTLTRQVFANLLANAIKFTRLRKLAVIEVGHFRSAGETVLFVRDNGVGFSMQYTDKLFGVFQRLHRREDFEGTGIGLATVQRIVHKHGGRIWPEAEPEQGATFYFTLEPSRQEHLEQPNLGTPAFLEGTDAIQRSS